MEETPQLELYSLSTGNENFSSSVSFYHSDSNLSNKENTHSNIEKKNVSQNNKESQIKNWMEDEFHFKDVYCC